MANQVTVSNNNTINVTVEPPANVQVQVSRAVIGTVANVSNANLANYVTQPNQSNITSVGTLTGLTSSGNITAPFFIGNVVGNISGNIVVPGTNTAVLFNQQGNAGASDALTFNYSSNVLTANGNIVANYFIGNGSQLTDIVAVNANYANYANISNVANSVAVANVVGIGNIAVINLDGNVSNILHGNGYWGPESGSLNANYANFAGDVVNASQPNITSLGTLTGLVVGGDITPNSNVTHNLGNNTNRFNDLYLAGNTIYLGAQELSANATGISFTGILTGNANGLSNITGANITGYVANATHSNVADLANSVAGANVTGQVNYAAVANSVAGANVSGQVAYAAVANSVAGANVSGEVSYAAVANSVAGANVSGAVSLATYATTANSVAGANVSGQVGYAAVANSVAVANVVGIGNIATVNLDGNVANLLTGAGTFVAIPTGGGNTANANYANFAGTVITNAQPNITSVGTLTSLDVTGNVSANAYQLTTSPGTLNAATGQMVWSASEQTMNLGMNYGVVQQVGLETYILIKASATITDGQVVMFTGANGDNVTGAPADTTSVGFRPEYIIGVATQNIANNDFGYVTVFGVVRGLNTNAYNVGDILWVDNATPGGLTSTRPSDPNFQIEIAAVTKKSGGDGHIQVRVTTFNDINSLTDVTITTPANGQALVYSGNVWVNGNPNIANIANTVSDNAQPNITSTGNLVYLNVRDDSNANSVIRQFAPNSVTVPSNFTTNTAYDLTTIYWPNASTGFPVSTVVRSRGNATTPTTAAGGDRITQNRYMAYNGNTNVFAGSQTFTLSGAINSNSNAAYTGGQLSMTTGNPAGDIGNSDASSGVNVLTFNNSGGLQITPGTAPNTSLGQSTSSVLITNYGQSTANLVRSGGLNFQRARGNRDAPQTVQPGDHVGASYFLAYSNGAYQSSNVAQYRVIVDSSYVANDTIVPMSHQFATVSNVGNVATFLNTTFYSNGTAEFPGDITTYGTGYFDNLTLLGAANIPDLNVTNVSNLGSNSNVIITGGSSGYVLSTNGSGNLSWVAQSGGGGSSDVDFTPSFLLGGM